MKQNAHTKIMGKKVVLVPYKKEHVPKYHDWMQSQELQEQTASDPLTLDQEYEMQVSWYEDEKKCTFILLDSSLYQETLGDEIKSMIGDVNLFFNNDDDPHSAEIEIMIAEKEARQQGCGTEALFAMMQYGIFNLNIKTVTAKIGFSNTTSLVLFEKLGFSEVSRSDVFNEVTLHLPINEDARSMIVQNAEHLVTMRQS